MGLSNAAMIDGANAIRAKYGWAQLHKAAVGDGTANLCASSRLAITWAVARGDGDFDISAPVLFTGGVPDEPVYSVTIWSAGSGGTCGGEWPITGDPAFNSLGEYSLDSIFQNGSSNSWQLYLLSPSIKSFMLTL